MLFRSGFDPVDASASMPKNYGLMRMFLKFYDQADAALKSGSTIDEIIQSPIIERLARARYTPEGDFAAYTDSVLGELDSSFKAVKA